MQVYGLRERERESRLMHPRREFPRFRKRPRDLAQVAAPANERR